MVGASLEMRQVARRSGGFGLCEGDNRGVRGIAWAVGFLMAMTGCSVEPISGSAGSSQSGSLASSSVTAPSSPVTSATLPLASASASAPTSRPCIQTTFPQFPPDFPAVLPPPACIHGIAGLPASWCWEGCVDGGPRGPEGLPLAMPPFEVTVPEGSRITSASAFLPGAPDAHHHLDVERGTTLSGLPPTADMISVTVFWAKGGDAEYYWAVTDVPPDS